MPNIPIMLNMTKKEEINPFGGALGRAFRKILIPDNSFEASLGVQVTVLDFVSAVTPSSEDGLPSVLLMLDGWI
jgi:hypothetical protein